MNLGTVTYYYTAYTTYGTRTFFEFDGKLDIASVLKVFQENLCVLAVSKSGIIYRYKGNNKWNKD